MGRPSNSRQKLLEVASTALWESPTLAVSVDTLCKRAGINKGSFYYFFPSKTDLILHYLDDAWIRLRTNALEPSFAPGIPPLERIDRYFRAILVQQEEQLLESGKVYGCPFVNVGQELATLEPRIRVFIQEIIERQIIYFQSALFESQLNKNKLEDPNLISHLIYNILHGALGQSKIRQNLSPLASAREQIKIILVP